MKAINKYFKFQKYFNYFGFKQVNFFFTFLVCYLIIVGFLLNVTSVNYTVDFANLAGYSFFQIVACLVLLFILLPMLLICYVFKLLNVICTFLKLYLFKQQYFFSTDFLTVALDSNLTNSNFFTVSDLYSINVLKFFSNIMSFFSDVSINYLDYPLFFYFGLFFFFFHF